MHRRTLARGEPKLYSRGASSGLHAQVIPLRDAERACGGALVVPLRALVIARDLQKMGADRIETIVAGDSWIRVEDVEQHEPRCSMCALNSSGDQSLTL